MSGMRLEVDWIRCRGHGLCAELAPECIEMDDWGFPIITGDVTGEALKHARRACDACPSSALRLVKAPVPASSRRGR